MKIYLNNEQLKTSTNGNPEVMLEEGLENEKKRLFGMIKHKMRFCSLVTGYRGTGKSTFIRYALDEVKKDTDLSLCTVQFNATKYDDYEVFIKRFIRELYLQSENGKKEFPQLEKLYLHTFFDIKETGGVAQITNVGRKNEWTSERNTTSTVEVNGNKMLKYIVSVVALILSATFECENKVVTNIIKILAFLWVIFNDVFNVSFTTTNIGENITDSSAERKNEESILKSIETLYDDEIAEYHLYEELKVIGKKKSIIFVLDELDKIETKDEWDKIFHDLKPLFLLQYCSTILIGGKNIEKYVSQKITERDAIVSSIFSNRIYIPLSTTKDMMEFAAKFYENNLEHTFYEDVGAQQYFKKKIYESKGVKRVFINSIVSDLCWDENYRAYVNMDDSRDEKNFEVIFEIHTKLEDYICENYINEKRDELILLLYEWLEFIKMKMDEQFTKEEILAGRTNNEKCEERDSFYYTEEKERVWLCDELLKCMCEERILKIDGTSYKWEMKAHVDMLSNKEEIINELERIERNAEYSYNMICLFACYNNLISLQKYKELTVKKTDNQAVQNLFDDMVDITEGVLRDKTNIYFSKKILESELFEMDDAFSLGCDEKWKRYAKGQIAEMLLMYTYKRELGAKLDVYRNAIKDKGFDIVCKISQNGKVLFTNVKCFKDYRQAIRIDRLINQIKEMIVYTKQNNLEVSEGMYRIIIFTDSIVEEATQFEQKYKKIVAEDNLGINLEIVVISLKDEAQFMTQMSKLIREIKETNDGKKEV